MTLLSQSAVGAILNHYADVIEGGNAYAGGTSYIGVPGVYSHHELADPDLSSNTLTAASGSTTTVVTTTLGASLLARLVRSDAAPFFLLSLTQASLTRNVNTARRITAHDGSTQLTVDAFDEAVAATDTFQILEGFKRMPDFASGGPNDEPGAYDRGFRLRMSPGVDAGVFGSGIKDLRTNIRVMLRLRKTREHIDLEASAMENMNRIRIALAAGGNRDGTYVQSVTVPDSEPTIDETASHITVTDALPLVYRIQTELR